MAGTYNENLEWEKAGCLFGNESEPSQTPGEEAEVGKEAGSPGGLILCLDVPPKHHMVINGVLSEVVRSLVSGDEIYSWCNARLSGRRIMGARATRPKWSG